MPVRNGILNLRTTKESDLSVNKNILLLEGKFVYIANFCVMLRFRFKSTHSLVLVSIAAVLPSGRPRNRGSIRSGSKTDRGAYPIHKEISPVFSCKLV
jgi:hypothetical protein